jgi:hypothetical protein
MALVVTILDGEVAAEKWAEMRAMYEMGGQHKPPQLAQGFLVQNSHSPTSWRTICVWHSPEALDEYRRSEEIPGGLRMFRSVGAEPTETVFEVAGEMR